MMRAFWVATLACGLVGHTRPAVTQVDQQRAQAYFKEAQALCERDGGCLWGVSVCAPMVIGDARTQTFATSQPPPDGPRPRLAGLMNTPIQWGGVTWILYAWEDLVNATPQRRNEIMLHEMFHGVQARLGLAVGILENEHLDALDGRYWLQLEWRALARALRASGVERNAAVRDALAFRQARRRIYPAAAENERGLAINEGVASYTGTVLAASSRADATASALAGLTGAKEGESFVRTFAYVSGPAYGLLLDEASPGWRRALRSSDDLGILLMIGSLFNRRTTLHSLPPNTAASDFARPSSSASSCDRIVSTSCGGCSWTGPCSWSLAQAAAPPTSEGRS